jgi:hypothetical protein
MFFTNIRRRFRAANSQGRLGSRGYFRPIVEVLEPRLVPSVVTTLLDENDSTPDDPVGNDGVRSLREAILLANQTGGGMITFAVSGTINVGATGLGPLPRINVPVTIDGGGAIELNGSHSGGVGLWFAASGNTIKNLTINRFDGDGIYLAANNNVIQGNHIGTDPTLGNGTGIFIDGSNNLIGGSTPVTRNIISGNGDGIHLADNNNMIQGNYIGTDPTGTIAKGNGTGIFIDGSNNLIGGSTPAARNIISGNLQSAGIWISGATGNVVQGNYIGTDSTGTLALHNFHDIYIANEAPPQTNEACCGGSIEKAPVDRRGLFSQPQ